MSYVYQCLLLGCLALFLSPIGGCGQRKQMVVERMNVPDPANSDGTVPAFAVYYVWNGQRDPSPWWFIMKMPFGERETTWAVTEICNRPNDSAGLANAINEARKLSANWFESGVVHLRRTPVEKVQHVLFGGDALPVERNAIAEVLRLTQAADSK